MKSNSKEVKKLLPTQEAFGCWQEIVFFSSGIKFSTDVIIAAYFMDVGYRSAMNLFSQFSLTENKEEPWDSAILPYLDIDNNWTDNLSTDTIDALINKCCLIQLSMEHPKYGDSNEYKEKFNKALAIYTGNNEKVGINLLEKIHPPFPEMDNENTK